MKRGKASNSYTAYPADRKIVWPLSIAILIKFFHTSRIRRYEISYRHREAIYAYNQRSRVNDFEVWTPNQFKREKISATETFIFLVSFVSFFFFFFFLVLRFLFFCVFFQAKIFYLSVYASGHVL